MHELSIVMSIVDIASAELKKANGSSIEEIELEIGCLSGVEMSSFDFAWQTAVKDTSLSIAQRNIHHIDGKGRCLDCSTEFAMEHLYDCCPTCNGHFINILKGKELRVKSIIVN